MPPKAKPLVKKKKKAPVDVPPVPRSLYGVGSGNENPEKSLLEKLVTRSDLVFVRLKQADWAYSDFTVMVHASAPLYTLCRKIEEKHGRMGLDASSGATTLQLFRHPPNEKNLLPPSEWHLRLDQLGMAGGTVEEQHQAIVYYNYVPAGSSALLQREPQLMLHALSAEENEAYHEAQASRMHGTDSMMQEAGYMDAVHTHASTVSMNPNQQQQNRGSLGGGGSAISLGGVGASVSAAAAAASTQRLSPH